MPGRGEVLIGVRACGVCHGDLMVQTGAFPFARYPIVPGHEIAGVVAAVGEDVDGLEKGARVGLSALGSSCGRCDLCLAGDEFLCPELQFTGVTRDGGYAEFVVVRLLQRPRRQRLAAAGSQKAGPWTMTVALKAEERFAVE